MDILELAQHNQRCAWEIMDTTGLIRAWESIGATVNVIGSLRSGLLCKSRDIDMHIYTDKLDIAESFAVTSGLAQRLPLKQTQYINGVDTDEECIEWHSLYDDKQGNEWKFDMIQIRRGGKYDGTVERVTEAIIGKLTPELRRTILQIKYDVPDGIMIPGIEIYHAVFTGKVTSYEQLERWRATNPLTDRLEWLP
ncbi:MAG: phosphoglycerate mutase family protein [Rikenellaceae bacterium]|nr:phosphoglycerate mutase family protein [Rikenellaceae bacterium]